MVVKLKIKDVDARNFRSDIVNVSFRLAERDMFIRTVPQKNQINHISGYINTNVVIAVFDC